MVAKAGKLDYETEPMHTLTIEASDQASPDSMQRFSTAEVRSEISVKEAAATLPLNLR